MRIVDEKMLDKFRGPGCCEICGKRCNHREPHHLVGRGFGGGNRLDISINLIGLGASQPFPHCPCHGEIHAGRISFEQVLEFVALREWRSPQSIIDEMEMLRLKETTAEQKAANRRSRKRKPMA